MYTKITKKNKRKIGQFRHWRCQYNNHIVQQGVQQKTLEWKQISMNAVYKRITIYTESKQKPKEEACFH